MGSILKRAVLQGYIGQNPVYLVKELKLRKQEMNCLTKEQITNVLNFAKANYPSFYPLLFTAIFTGLRRGELLSLTWNDVNFEIAKITVNKSLKVRLQQLKPLILKEKLICQKVSSFKGMETESP